MKYSSTYLIAFFTANLTFGCSFINNFDEILPEAELSAGQGGSVSSDALDDGERGQDTDDTENNDSGSGPPDTSSVESEDEVPEEVEPGLIVSIPNSTDSENSLYVVSPQNGSILSSLPKNLGSITFAAHEAKRDIWFLRRDGKIQAGTFDRLANEWTLGEQGPTTNEIPDPSAVFAFPERLAVLERGPSSQEIKVYDTSDPDSITLIPGGVVDATGFGTLWSIAGNANANNGGKLYILAKNCGNSIDGEKTCPAEVTTITIQGDVVETAATAKTVGQIFQTIGVMPMGNVNRKSSTGAIVSHPITDKVIILLPNEDDNTLNYNRARAYVYDAGLTTIEGQYDTPLVGEDDPNKIVTAALDPCQNVLYFMLTGSTRLLGLPLSVTVSDGATILNQSVNVDGQSMAYDHATGNLFILEDTSADYGIDSWDITGTPTAPDLTQNIVGWTRPDFRPSFMAVAQPKNIVCPVE